MGCKTVKKRKEELKAKKRATSNEPGTSAALDNTELEDLTSPTLPTDKAAESANPSHKTKNPAGPVPAIKDKLASENLGGKKMLPQRSRKCVTFRNPEASVFGDASAGAAASEVEPKPEAALTFAKKTPPSTTQPATHRPPCTLSLAVKTLVQQIALNQIDETDDDPEPASTDSKEDSDELEYLGSHVEGQASAFVDYDEAAEVLPRKLESKMSKNKGKKAVKVNATTKERVDESDADEGEGM